MFVICGLLESNKYEEREENICVCSVVIFLLATCLINFLKKQVIRVCLVVNIVAEWLKTDLVPLQELGKLSILKHGHKSACIKLKRSVHLQEKCKCSKCFSVFLQCSMCVSIGNCTLINCWSQMQFSWKSLRKKGNKKIYQKKARM